MFIFILPRDQLIAKYIWTILFLICKIKQSQKLLKLWENLISLTENPETLSTKSHNICPEIHAKRDKVSFLIQIGSDMKEWRFTENNEVLTDFTFKQHKKVGLYYLKFFYFYGKYVFTQINS